MVLTVKTTTKPMPLFPCVLLCRSHATSDVTNGQPHYSHHASYLPSTSDLVDCMSDSASMISSASNAQQLHMVVGDNRDLIVKLAATHRKLKMTKARLVQAEASLRVSQAQVRSHNTRIHCL